MTLTEMIPEMTELTAKELETVSAGTFTPNTYRKSEYQSLGISTSYHFFDKDEFQIMGRSITYDQANEIVEMARTLNKAMNEGYKGANKIGYSEKRFVNALNSQLYLKYGFMWDGNPGHDF